MAKLFTTHDKFRLHAISGMLCLASLLVRWLLLLGAGSGFTPAEPNWAKISTLAVHALAPLLSLGIAVPVRRNMSRPMIWPEFRMQYAPASLSASALARWPPARASPPLPPPPRAADSSLIFSTRQVLSCLIALYAPAPFAQFAQLAVAHAAMVAATQTTELLGDKELRTTSAMPYPDVAAASEIAMVKNSYAYAQLLATAQAVSGNADLGFMPIAAIQLAPLMMTLVRKGLAKGEAYHLVYSVALAAPALGMAAASLRSAEAMRACAFTLLCGLSARELRFRLGVGKHTTWLLAPAIGWAASGALVAGLPLRVATPLVVSSLLLVLVQFRPPALAASWLRLAARKEAHKEASPAAPAPRPSAARARTAAAC